MKLERVLGVMMGLAVGDALGVPVEFMNEAQIVREYGKIEKMIGGGTWGQKAGTVSDDTAMALAVAEGITEDCVNPVPAIGKKFIEWYGTNPFDIGVCCSSVICGAMETEGTADDWFKVAKDYHDATKHSGGNGGLMRTAFVGMYYRNSADVARHAKEICKMTHWDEQAESDCALVSMIIHALVDGGDKETIRRIINTNRMMNMGYGYEVRNIEERDVAPSGYTRNSLMCALKSVLTTYTFRDAVEMAVNMGGDTDTIGAITGAIAGALYGFDEIPREWAEAISDDVVERIIKVCTKAYVRRFAE